MEENEISKNRENPLFGRKVYFINPPLIVENIVIEDLRSEEYEVYVIDDYHSAKAVLENNKDALVFIYIDDDMDYDQWFNYIKSFSVNEKLKSIFIGVLSYKANYNIRERYLMDLQLPGGFIILNEKIDVSSTKIKDILNLNGAKGRRKYLRLDCRKNDSVSGYLAYKDRLYNFSIDDISSVGFACSYPSELVSVFPKNIVHPCVSLTLGRKTIVASSVVFDTRVKDDKGISVMLFTKEVTKEVKNSIRNFIYDMLDEAHKDFLNNSIQDLTDYTQKIEDSKESDIPAYNDIADLFVGPLEELPDMDNL